MLDFRKSINALFHPAIRSRVTSVFNAFWGQMFVALTAFAAIRLFTEWLTKAEFGRAMLIMAVIAFVDGMTGMAFNQTLLSHCAPLPDRESRRQLSVGLAGHASIVVLPIGFVLSAALALAYSLKLLPLWWAILPVMIGVYVVFECLKYSLLSLLAVERDYLRFSIWSAGEALIGLIFMSMLIGFWRADSVGYETGYFLSRIISTVFFLFIFSRGRHLERIDFSIARSGIAAVVAYGYPISLMAPLGWVTTYLDRFILSTMLGVATTGNYVAAVGLVSRPFALTTAVLTNFFRPLLYQRTNEHREIDDASAVRVRAQRRLLVLWIGTAFVVGVLGMCLFATLGTWITQIMLAPDYRHGAVPLMVAFACAQTLTIMTHGADNVILSLGKSSRLLIVQSGLSLFTLTLIPIGIIYGGVMGALLGRCLAELIKLAVTTLLAVFLLSGSGPTSAADVPQGKELNF